GSVGCCLRHFGEAPVDFGGAACGRRTKQISSVYSLAAIKQNLGQMDARLHIARQEVNRPAVPLRRQTYSPLWGALRPTRPAFKADAGKGEGRSASIFP